MECIKLPCMNTNFMSFIISLSKDFWIIDDLFTNDKEGYFDIDCFQISQKVFCYFIRPIIKTLKIIRSSAKRATKRSYCSPNFRINTGNNICGFDATTPRPVTVCIVARRISILNNTIFLMCLVNRPYALYSFVTRSQCVGSYFQNRIVFYQSQPFRLWF